MEILGEEGCICFVHYPQHKHAGDALSCLSAECINNDLSASCVFQPHFLLRVNLPKHASHMSPAQNPTSAFRHMEFSASSAVGFTDPWEHGCYLSFQSHLPLLFAHTPKRSSLGPVQTSHIAVFAFACSGLMFLCFHLPMCRLNSTFLLRLFLTFLHSI